MPVTLLSWNNYLQFIYSCFRFAWIWSFSSSQCAGTIPWHCLQLLAQDPVERIRWYGSSPTYPAVWMQSYLSSGADPVLLIQYYGSSAPDSVFRIKCQNPFVPDPVPVNERIRSKRTDRVQLIRMIDSCKEYNQKIQWAHVWNQLFGSSPLKNGIRGQHSGLWEETSMDTNHFMAKSNVFTVKE